MRSYQKRLSYRFIYPSTSRPNLVILDFGPRLIVSINRRSIKELKFDLKQIFCPSIVFWAALTTQCLAAEWSEGRVTQLRDVDTVEVNGLPIRLEGVDGPELSEWGGRNAKRWMQKIVLRKPAKCQLTGAKNRDRWIGVCFLNDQDIGALAIAAGQARDCPRYSGGRCTEFETAKNRSLPQHGYCR